MSLTPLRQKILRTLTRSQQTFRERSAKKWIVHPAERQTTPKAIYLEDDLDKVTAVMEDSSYKQELARILGGETEHAPTIAYQLNGCELLDGSLYHGPMRLPLTKESPRLLAPDVEETLAHASLSSSYYGSFYFGHWMTDDLTLQLAAAESGTPVMVARKPYGHEPGYCELLGIERRAVRRARFDNLVMFDDFGQNGYKRERYQQLRSRLKEAVTSQNHERVFIRRGSQGVSRALTNSAEIEQYLVRQGFVIVEPESLTPRKIAEVLTGARLVVGLEGSHMVHSLFTMAAGGTVCLLQPPFRFTNVLKNYTDCLGMSYAFLTGRAADCGFAVKMDELKRLLERLDRRTVVDAA